MRIIMSHIYPDAPLIFQQDSSIVHGFKFFTPPQSHENQQS